MLINRPQTRRPQDLHLAVQPIRVANARFMAHVSAWSMDTDMPVDVDVFALIIAVSQRVRPDTPFNRWTDTDTLQFPMLAAAFCHNENIFEPDDLREQVAMFVAFLDETNWRDRALPTPPSIPHSVEQTQLQPAADLVQATGRPPLALIHQ